MGSYRFKEIYLEEGKKVLEVNVLPEKYCNFDCIFCPIGRSDKKVDTQMSFDKIEELLLELESRVKDTGAELVFINSKGESFINDKIEGVINFIKTKGLPVRLLTNGYLLGKEKYIAIANKCDEIVGEIKAITEEDFQKIQRPMEGYRLEEYISNMASFNKQYKGKFIFEITIIKGYNDDEKSIEKIKDIIKKIEPNKIIVSRLEEEKFQRKLGISDKRYIKISELLRKAQ